MSEPVSYERLMEIAKKSILAHAYDLYYCKAKDFGTYGSWDDAITDNEAWARELNVDVEAVKVEFGLDFGSEDDEDPYLTNDLGEKIFEGDTVVPIPTAGTYLLCPTDWDGAELDVFTPVDELIVEEVVVDKNVVHLSHGGKHYSSVRPNELTPVCPTCHGLGLLSKDTRDECPDCNGAGMPERNLP